MLHTGKKTSLCY